MITKNGAIIFAHRLYETSVQSGNGLKKIDGTTVTNNYSTMLGTARSNIFETTSANTGVVMNIGSGSAAESADDYCLAQPLTANDYQCSVPGASPVSVTATSDGNMVYTFTFYAVTDCTINEIGLFALNNSGKVLLARKVIPARQVTAGETFTFSYVVKFN